MTKIICVTNDEVKTGGRLKAEHGLSLWIQLDHTAVLFDCGMTPEVLEHNLHQLGLSPINIDALVFSHAHDDHTGGVSAIFPERTTIPLIAHSDLFRARYSNKNGVYKFIGISMKEADLSHYFYLKLTDESVEVAPDLWTTGVIVNRPERMGTSNNHLIHNEGGWHEDPYLDDLSLVLRTYKGNVLICGCCHAGILNTLYHAESKFDGPFIAVVGGTHLMTADDQYLNFIIETFQRRYPDCEFYLNHCTGKHAIELMQEKLGERVKTFLAGDLIQL